MRCCGCMQARSMLLEALYCSCLLTVPRTTVPGDESAATRQTPDGKPPKHSKAMQQMCSVTLRPSISRYSVYIQTPFAKQTPAKSPHRRLNAPNTNRRAFKLPDRREHSSFPPHPATGFAARCSTVVCSAGLVKGIAGSCISSLHALEPQLAYVVDRIDDILWPIFLGWLVLYLMSALANRARQWCDSHPDEPLSLEMIGLLPAVVEGPSRFAVSFLVMTRVLRNLAALLAGYVNTFKPQLHALVDMPVRSLMAALGPIDKALISVYIIVAVALSTRVLIKYKSIFIDYLIKRQRTLERGAGDEGKTSAAAAAAAAATVSSSDSIDSGSDSNDGSAPALDNTALICSEGVGRQMVIALCPRPTSPQGRAAAAATLSSSSTTASRAPAAAGVGGTKSAAAAVPRKSGVAGTAFAVASDVARKSSRYSSLVKPGWNLEGKSADDLERLLLPLDSILSWVLVVIAGLCTVQFLGLDVRPLLAIGGAGGIIIGLATQTLLSNLVMGVNIFLSRPFVPGDAITVQGPSNFWISGTVERVTPMRTLMRTDDDVLVTMPNKSIADMVIYNKSRQDMRKRFSPRNRERQYLKFKVKLPNKELERLEGLEHAIRQTMRRPGVSQHSIEVGLSKFSELGAELLVKFLILVPPGSEAGQRFMFDLAMAARQHGATLVSII